MSTVVFGAGASHTTLMNTRWEAVDHLPRAHAFRDGLATARAELAAVEPDLVVIVGSNHFRGFWLDLMPAFTIGVGDVLGAGEHGTPGGPQRTDPPAALALCEALLAARIDVAFSAKLQVDHGITHAIQYVVPDGLPMVPVVINAFAPPLPSLARCLELGDALRAAVAALPGARRVAVVATGGLSHQVPFPDWRDPHGDDEVFLTDTFREGRGRWEEFEGRRREIVVGAEPRLAEQFDRELLGALEGGGAAAFAEPYDGPALVATAGNGANEIRAWLAMAAACGHAPARTVAYAAMPEWLTGMAVSVIDPTATGAPA